MVVLLLLRTLLILSLFREKFLGLVTNFLILTEGICKSLVLLVAEFEARFSLDLSQVILLR